MTGPVSVLGGQPFGPGTLKIGSIGTEVDYSCLVRTAKVTSSVSTSETTTRLCGTKIPGVSSPTAQFTADLDVDGSDTEALFRLCSENAFTIQHVVFTPSTSWGLAAEFDVTIVPMGFGSDGAVGEGMHESVTWDVAGNIEYDDGTNTWTQDMTPRAAVLPTPTP